MKERNGLWKQPVAQRIYRKFERLSKEYRMYKVCRKGETNQKPFKWNLIYHYMCIYVILAAIKIMLDILIIAFFNLHVDRVFIRIKFLNQLRMVKT